MKKESLSREELRESEERFRVTFEHAAVGIVHVNPDGRFLRVNQRFCDIVKYSKEELLSLTFQEITHTDDLVKNLMYVRKMLKGELKTCSTEKRYLCKDKSIAWVNLTVSLVRNQSNEPIYFISVTEDITSRKAMKIALEESESRYRNIIENTTDVIIVTGFNGKHLYVSPRYKDLFGRTPDQIDKFILDYLHPDDRASLITLYQESFRNRYAAAPNQEIEFRILHQNGSYIWVSSITKNYYDEEGKIVGVITSLRDIRKHKEAERKLIESEKKYRHLFESSPYFIGLVDKNGTLIDCNSNSFLAIYTKKDLIGKTFLELFSIVEENKELIPIFKKLLQDAYSKDQRKVYEFKFHRSAGGFLWLKIESSTVEISNQKLIQFIIQDITNRKIIEEELKESEIKFRNIFEANPSGMHLYDLTSNNDLIFKGANYAADKILKIDNKKNIGKTIEEAFPPLIRTEIPIKYRMVASEGITLNWKHFNYIDDQINSVYEIYAFQTAPGSMTASFLDITDRLAVKQKLKELNRLKSELLRRLSHELKTPLTSIIGAVEILLTIYEKDFNEKTEQFLNIIKNGGKRLENLIKDFLNVSRLQTHIIEIDKYRENITKLIIDSINEVKIFATERNIHIIFNQEGSIYINVDKNKILQVFVNLIMNAIKYTPPKGEISIKIEAPTENLIDIIIKDTGIGFTEEEKKIIFKQFGKIERFGQGFEINTEGSGLGLYISKELVELHSGKLWVESEGRNQGSSFIIRLPKF